MNMNSRRTRLIEKLKNKEYRDSYISSNVDVNVAFQIRALRKQKNYTQKELAKKANMKQERISALENPSKAPNISTLKKLANAFDVGLIVKFLPISELLEWQLNLSPESLEVSSFNEDPYFSQRPEKVLNLWGDIQRSEGEQDEFTQYRQSKNELAYLLHEKGSHQPKELLLGNVGVQQ